MGLFLMPLRRESKGSCIILYFFKKKVKVSNFLKGKTMKLMQKTIWAITPEMLSSMIAIAHQTNRTPEAIAKEMGRDMKNTYAVSTRGGVAEIGRAHV